MVTLLMISLGLSLIETFGTSAEKSTPAAVVVDDVAPGTILVDVQGGAPYRQYAIKPSAGMMQVVKEDKSADYYQRIPKTLQQPMGAIDSCSEPFKSEAASLNGKLLARCVEVSRFVNSLLVINLEDATTAYQWKPKGRRIRGFAWAPNSRSVAVLNDSSYVGMNPLEIFEALSGHPVSHYTVYLDIINTSTGDVTEYLLVPNVTNSWERILSWSK